MPVSGGWVGGRVGGWVGGWVGGGVRSWVSVQASRGRRAAEWVDCRAVSMLHAGHS
jgi:hypothetical protein